METFDYVLSKALEEMLEVRVSSLACGAPTDYPAYCMLVGEIRGLRLALQSILKARAQVKET